MEHCGPGAPEQAPPQGWFPGLPTKDLLPRAFVQQITFDESQKRGRESKRLAQISVGAAYVFRHITGNGLGADPNLAGKGSCPVSASAQQQSHQGWRDKQTCQSLLLLIFPVNLFPCFLEGCRWLRALSVLDPAPPQPTHTFTKCPFRVGLPVKT